MEPDKSTFVWCKCCNEVVTKLQAIQHAASTAKNTIHPEKDDPRNRPAFPGSSVTSIQFVMMMLTAQSGSTGFSQRAFNTVMDIIGNSLLAGIEHTIPMTFREAKAMVDEYLCPIIPYKACPLDCILYVGENKDLLECPKCHSKKDEAKTFFYLPIIPRLQRMYGVPALASIFQTSPEENDIRMSTAYRALIQNSFGGDERTIILGYSTDGVCPFDHLKTTHSVNVQAMKLYNLPPTIRDRTEMLPLIGLIQGPHAPKNLNAYLDIIIDEMLCLEKGVTTYDGSRNKNFQLKAAILVYICDFPGKTKLILTKGAGGERACNSCKQIGQYEKVLSKMVYVDNRRFLPLDHPLRLEREGFPRQEQEERPAPEKRTKSEQLSFDSAASAINVKSHKETLMKETGKLGVESLYRLTNYDPQQAVIDMMHTTQRVAEHMHGIINGHRDSLNVRETEVLLNRSATENTRVPVDGQGPGSSKRSRLEPVNWRLSDKDMKTADERSLRVKVPIGFGWAPRLLFTKLSHMKSHDWYQVYTSGVIKFCLRGLLGEKQRNTLFRLCDVLQLLNSRKIGAGDLDALRVNVAETLSLVERDFPIAVQVISLHNLHHVVDNIEQFGPTPGYRMFSFERLNSYVCRLMRRLRSNPEATAVESFRIFELCCLWKFGNLLPTSFNVETLIEDVEDELQLEVSNKLLAGEDTNEECGDLLQYHRQHDIKFEEDYRRLRRLHRQGNIVEPFRQWKGEELSEADRAIIRSPYQLCRYVNISISKGVDCIPLRGAARPSNISPVISLAVDGSVKYAIFQYVIEHLVRANKCKLLKVDVFLSVQQCRESNLLFCNPNELASIYIHPRDVIAAVATALDDGTLWILNPVVN